ncbi:MAG: FAD-dependent oxidoreductase, partial [Bacilli bacterium]
MIYDILIIGGGPAGMSAALYALRSGKTVLILEKENFGGQIANSPRVENWPSTKEIAGLEFSDHLFNQITDLGADFELEDVQSIEKQTNMFVIKTNYQTHQSRTVIIASGVTHRQMNLPHEEQLIGKGVSFCAVCDGPFYKGQEVYLVGDANTALQYALLLANYCPKVHMFTLFDRLFGD